MAFKKNYNPSNSCSDLNVSDTLLLKFEFVLSKSVDPLLYIASPILFKVIKSKLEHFYKASECENFIKQNKKSNRIK